MGFEKGLLTAADWMAGLVGFGNEALTPDSVMKAVRKQAKHADFGPLFGEDVFMPALLRLCTAVENTAELSHIGRIAFRWDSARFLSNLLRLERERAKCPEVTAIPIERPLFITGLPRSGTSFLHSLLAEDPENLAPRCYETLAPYPPAEGRDRREDVMARHLRNFSRLAPGFRSVHPIDARSPQECTEITAHVFQSLRFDTTYFIPSYRDWLDADGHESAYKFHRYFLQHLQRQRRKGHWVLKCPDHVFALPAIKVVYPDADLVFVHRDPLEVLPSVARLTEILRAPFARRVDREAIGQEVSARWVQGAALMLAETEADTDRRIFHIEHTRLVSDPMGVVTQLYKHIGRFLSESAAERIAALVKARPKGGYGANVYCFADHGLQAEVLRKRFGAYRHRFGVSQKSLAE